MATSWPTGKRIPKIDPNNKLYDFLWPEPGTGTMSSTDSKIFEFLWRDLDLKPKPISDLPLFRYYGAPYGWMTARTGWDEQRDRADEDEYL